MVIQPYLFFDGRCEEAVAFYRRALGAEVIELMRFDEAPEAAGCEGAADNGAKVLHASLRIGETMVMASDGRCGGQPDFRGFSLSLTAADAAEANRLFAALADGGTVQMPLHEAFFSPCFGIVADRFGVSWMLYVAPAD